MKLRLIVMLIATAFVLFTAPAWATNVGFDFSQNGNGHLTNTAGCTGSGFGCVEFFDSSHTYELDITGFSSNGHENDLYFKNSACCAGTEVGLGLNSTTDNEVNLGTQFLQLNVAKLFAAGATSLIIGGNSTTAGESWGIFYSNIDGTRGSTLAASGSSGGTFTTVSTGSSTYLDFASLNTNGGGDVLATSTPVPEPTTLWLLGSGFLGLGGMYRRKRLVA